MELFIKVSLVQITWLDVYKRQVHGTSIIDGITRNMVLVVGF